MKKASILSKLRMVLLFGGVLILASACSLSFSSQGGSTRQGAEGSLFVTSDRGDTWQAAMSIPGLGDRSGSIAEVGVNLLKIDPQDHLAVYLGSLAHGLFYTYDIATGWNQVKSLPQTRINDLVVSPDNKCRLYAALGNQVFRSNDCSRTWEQIFVDSNQEVAINTLAVDHYNPNNIYLGTSRGEIMKSIDGGYSWRTIWRLDNGILQLTISPLDSRLIYVATSKNNIYHFTSNTTTNPANSTNIEANFSVSNWTDLGASLKNFNLGTDFRELIVNQKDGAVFIASAKGIIRSRDGGSTWENLNLLPPEKEATINSLAVNPNNSAELFYITDTTFFRSSDGGTTWTTKRLPSSRPGARLLIDFANPNRLYLGTRQAK